MDVPADFQRGLELEQTRLRQEDLTNLDTHTLHLGLRELHILSWLRTPCLEKLVDHCVHINVFWCLLHSRKRTCKSDRASLFGAAFGQSQIGVLIGQKAPRRVPKAE